MKFESTNLLFIVGNEYQLYFVEVEFCNPSLKIQNLWLCPQIVRDGWINNFHHLLQMQWKFMQGDPVKTIYNRV